MTRSKGVFFCWAIVKETVRKFFADNGLFLASGLSFDLLLYCMPLALLVVSGLGYTLVGSDQALAWVHESLQNFLPGSQQAFFDALDGIIKNRGPFGLVGFVAFFILTSALFGSVRIILNTVFQAPPPKSFLRGKFKDFLVMLGVSLLLLLTISVEIMGTIFNAVSEQIPSLRGLLHQGMSLATDLLSFVFTAALFFLLYRFSPSRSLDLPALLVGSLTGAILFCTLKNRIYRLRVCGSIHHRIIWGFGRIHFFLFVVVL